MIVPSCLESASLEKLLTLIGMLKWQGESAESWYALAERRSAPRQYGDGSAAAIPRLGHRETELVKARLGNRLYMSLDFRVQDCAHCELSYS